MDTRGGYMPGVEYNGYTRGGYMPQEQYIGY